MLVASEIETGGIPAPAITINARCLQRTFGQIPSICCVYSWRTLILLCVCPQFFTSFSGKLMNYFSFAGTVKQWKDGEGMILGIFFEYAAIIPWITHSPWKTASTKELSAGAIFWTTFCWAIPEKLPFSTMIYCLSMSLWILLVENIIHFNWTRISTQITRRVCFSFSSNMDLFTKSGFMIQNILLWPPILHICIFCLKYLTPTKRRIITSIFSWQVGG